MAGLLGDVLPWAFSQGDRAKRYLGGLLADPVGSMQQTAGLLQDYRREDQQLNAQAFADRTQPFRVTDKRAMTQLADRAMAGPMGFAPAGITVWHGTPHAFDKFDSSKIGTGEGAQVYGHGLYLAEKPGVAKSYQEKLSDATYKIDGQAMPGNSDAVVVASEVQSRGAQGAKAYLLAEAEKAASLAAQHGSQKMAASADNFRRWAGLVDEIASRKFDIESGGNLYKVDLPDSAVAKMLDYDKPVPEDVRQRVSRAAMERFGSGSTGTSGELLYKELVSEFTRAGSKSPTADAAEFLRKQGIPGVRYLDGTSRKTGDGSSNFVVFPGEESALKILERNGQPLK